MSVLSLNNVKKSYKLGDGSEFPVLKGINVSFDKGELVSLNEYHWRLRFQI